MSIEVPKVTYKKEPGFTRHTGYKKIPRRKNSPTVLLVVVLVVEEMEEAMLTVSLTAS